MFLKVLNARTRARARVYSWACEDFCIYSWACERKGKRKGRMKERENVQGCSAHQGRTSVAKSYCMRERSDVYAQEARAEPKGKKAESAAGVTQERRA